jgi:hypothetical protein
MQMEDAARALAPIYGIAKVIYPAVPRKVQTTTPHQAL